MSKQSLLAALQPRSSVVDVEGHGPVRLRELTVQEHDQVAAIVKAQGDGVAPSEMGLQLLLRSAIDEAGAPLLTEEDLPVLRTSGGAQVQKLVLKVLEVQGQHLKQGARDEAKNASAPTASGASASASPLPSAAP